MIRQTPDHDILTRKIWIGKMPVLVVMPKGKVNQAPGVLWIHGGGYFLGMKEMVYMSRAMDLVRKFGAVVLSPGYPPGFSDPLPGSAEGLLSGVRRECGLIQMAL